MRKREKKGRENRGKREEAGERVRERREGERDAAWDQLESTENAQRKGIINFCHQTEREMLSRSERETRNRSPSLLLVSTTA